MPPKVLDSEVAGKKEEYQLFEELERGRFGTVFRCFQWGPPLHQNGGLGGWWCGGGGCRQRGGGKEAVVVAAGEEVIIVVVSEEVAVGEEVVF